MPIPRRGETGIGQIRGLSFGGGQPRVGLRIATCYWPGVGIVCVSHCITGLDGLRVDLLSLAKYL